jgi:hypothetical protein
MQIKTAIHLALGAGLAVTLTLAGPRTAKAGEPRGESEAAAAESSSLAGPGCSDRTLRGDYAFVIEGTILAGPSPLLLRGVAMTHFDGHGSLHQVDFVTLNGMAGGADWRPATGTYEIDADCTGKAQIIPAGAPPLNLRLVVGDRGRQVFTIVIGNATGSTGIRVR